MLSNIISGLRITDDAVDLNRARLSVLSGQLPLMYAVIVINMVALGYTHYTYAPFWMSTLIPALLAFASAVRVAMHILRSSIKMTDAQVTLQLRLTFALSIILSAAFAIWAMALMNYGNDVTRGHVVFFTGVTTFACVICLMHVPAAAVAVTLTVFSCVCAALFTSGETVYVAISINLILVASASVYVLFGYSQNYAELIDKQKELTQKQAETQRLSDMNSVLANLDSLTNLPNRRNFFTQLDDRLVSGEARRTCHAIGILDLDGFKSINDLYGHPTGDKLLVEVGARLAKVGRDVFVGRLGGDEFGLIITGCKSDTDLRQRGREICRLMEIPFNLTDTKAHISASIGLVKLDGDESVTSAKLFEHADYALYHAKQASSVGQAVVFSEDHAAQIKEISVVERRLHDADFENEMSVDFQPIIEAGTGSIVGFEALARWHSPILGAVSPQTFIYGAERTGLINRLTEMLLKKALATASEWPEDVFLSFNLSSHDISSEVSVARLLNIVKKSGFPTGRLTFEVTETAIVQDFDRAREMLLKLRDMGIKIALDDFGTGYSSLSYIQNLPLDRLKMDGSFMRGVQENKVARSVVRAIVDLCDALGLECIVEGVETEAQLAIVSQMGCSKIQGYFFSKPMHADATLPYLNAEQRLTAAH